MAKMLMNLRGVPDEEAEEVRALLRRHDIDFYETAPNHWGLTMGAIWLRDESQAEEAKRRLAEYQEERQARMRAEYERRRREGNAETMVSLFLRDPLRVAIYLALVGVILYFSIRPFIGMGA